MKDLLRLIGMATLMLLASACIDCIRGSGPVIREDRPVSPFDYVQLETSCRVFLSPGADFKIAVEAQESLLPYIQTTLDAGSLKIHSRKCFWSSEDIYVFIQTPSLRGAGISGSGSIESDDFFVADGFEMKISGSGSILMQLDAEEVKARISGSGDIRLEGIAHTLHTQISGSGNLRALDLEVADVTAKISGSGDARVFATRHLEASISGSGDIQYKGEPEVRFTVTGSGSVRKVD